MSVRNRGISIVHGAVGMLVLAAAMSAVPALSQESPRAVPAIYLDDIKLPGASDHIVRPTVLHYDRFHDELLVGDLGRNRIVIFGSDGVYRFSFSLTGTMSSPRDVTTDPRGFITVLGSDPTGIKLQRFDYDGMPMEALDVPLDDDGEQLDLRHLACGDDGTLYVLDHQGRRILTLDGSGAVTASFPLRVSATREGVGDDGFALGGLSWGDGEFYVPVGNFGTVHRYSVDGDHLGRIGRFGSEPGTLNFPVAVEVSPDGIVMVLDRPRYVVVCFSRDGRFLGEFGGRGTSPGWFLGPSLLAVPASDRVIVGQVFRSKIQVCALPEFIRDQADRVSMGIPVPERTMADPNAAGNATALVSTRRSSANCTSSSDDGAYASSSSATALLIEHDSLTEVPR